MKSKIELNEELEYPLFAERIDDLVEGSKSSFIVMFTSVFEGTVVHAEENTNNSFKLGNYLNHWTEVTDQSTWKILPKGTSITLTS